MLANIRPDLMMPLYFRKASYFRGKHFVTKFEVTYASVQFTDSLAWKFRTECLFKVETFFFIIIM